MTSTQQVQVQVPAGVGPGGAFLLSNPMAPGQMVQVIVPAGMKAGDTFAVTLPASQPQMVPPQQQMMMPQQPTMIAQQPQYARVVPASQYAGGPPAGGPPAGGQTHQVAIQMQGVPTSVVIPATNSEGDRIGFSGGHDGFSVATANGRADLVCPRGSGPGQQLQFMSAPMVGVPTAPRPPDDTAVAQYEQLLAGVTRITVHDMRMHSEPTLEVAALRMFGKTASGNAGELGTLYLVINEPGPDVGVYNGDHGVVRCPEKVECGSAELQLSDGRVVMQLCNPVWRGAQIAQEVDEKKRNEWLRPEVQMMDREDLVRVTDETVLDDYCCSENSAPLEGLPQTRVSHPQSADETLKQGYQQVALASENSETTYRGKLGLFCCPIAFCMAICCAPAPDVHYQLKEVRSGNTVEGVLYTEKGRGWFENHTVYKHGRGAQVVRATGGLGYPRLIISDGDTLEFNECVPLQVRKDMLAVLVHRMTFNALGGVPKEPEHKSKPQESMGGGGGG